MIEVWPKFTIIISDTYPDPLEHHVRVRVVTTDNHRTYEAYDDVSTRFPIEQVQEAIRQTALDLRDKISFKVRLDQEARELNLTP